MRPDRADAWPTAQRCSPGIQGRPRDCLAGWKRRCGALAHYDYWSDTVRPSMLVSSKADLLAFGMGEKPSSRSHAASMAARTSATCGTCAACATCWAKKKSFRSEAGDHRTPELRDGARGQERVRADDAQASSRDESAQRAPSDAAPRRSPTRAQRADAADVGRTKWTRRSTGRSCVAPIRVTTRRCPRTP